MVEVAGVMVADPEVVAEQEVAEAAARPAVVQMAEATEVARR